MKKASFWKRLKFEFRHMGELCEVCKRRPAKHKHLFTESGIQLCCTCNKSWVREVKPEPICVCKDCK